MTDLEKRIEALEAQVRGLRDELAIRQILARYGPLVDSCTTEERLRKAAEFFGEHGMYDLGADQVFNGTDFAAQCLARGQHQEFLRSGSTHVMSMPYVLVEGEHATALGYSHVLQNMHDGSFRVVRGSVNYWEFERTDGEWHIVRRINRLMDGTEEPRALLHKVDATMV